MKNIQGFIVFITLVGVSVASAYYDQAGNWHEDVVTETLDTLTLGRYSDQPQDTHKRKEAARDLEDKKRSAQRKYQDKQEKIQRNKEDRRNRNK